MLTNELGRCLFWSCGSSRYSELTRRQWPFVLHPLRLDHEIKGEYPFDFCCWELWVKSKNGEPYLSTTRKVLWTAIAVLVAFTLVVGLFLWPCGRVEQRVLKVRLGWQFNANSAGQVAALEKRFYRDEGLEVELFPGGLDNPSIKTVAIGVDNFGFANGPDLVIKARAAGAPLKIVAVIQQKSYHGFVAKAGSGIRNPKDWRGRKVGVKHSSPTFLLYQALLSKLNVDRSTITEIPVRYGLQVFLEDQIDVFPCAFTNEVISLEIMGVQLQKIHPADYGIETCGNVLFATERMIREKPETVQRFVDATLRGWQWCLKEENWEESVTFLQRHSKHLKMEKEKQALKLNVELVNPADRSVPYIGFIDESKLRMIVKNLHRFGVIKKDIDVRDLYTNEFLPRVSK